MRALAAVAVAACVLAPSRARADTSLAVGLTYGSLGALELSMVVYDGVTMALHKAPGKPYPIVEIPLGGLTALVGTAFLGAALAPCSGGFGAVCFHDDPTFLAVGAAGAVVGALVAAHGIWGIATGGWGNAPHTHAALVPTVTSTGAGLALTGTF